MSRGNRPDITCDKHSPEDAEADGHDSVEGNGSNHRIQAAFVVIVFVDIESQSIRVQSGLRLVMEAEVVWEETKSGERCGVWGGRDQNGRLRGKGSNQIIGQ
jgi:hypothetical protein